jgi:hypothetical protein
MRERRELHEALHAAASYAGDDPRALQAIQVELLMDIRDILARHYGSC